MKTEEQCLDVVATVVTGYMKRCFENKDLITADRLAKAYDEFKKVIQKNGI